MSKKKNKSMSKRELVSYIHALTGLSFKESRILCKKAKYIEPLAYYLAVGTRVKKDGIEYYSEYYKGYVKIMF